MSENEPTVGERLAVLEDRNIRQSKDIKEILKEVKNFAELMHGIDTRLTKVETRQKIYGSIAAGAITFVAGLSMFKDKLMSFF